MIQQTSLMAYDGVKPRIGNRQGQILECLREHGPMTNKMISRKMGLPINCVTPRVLELRKLGLVVEYWNALMRGGRREMLWEVRP